MRMLKLRVHMVRIIATDLHCIFDALLGHVEMACPHTECVGIVYGHVVWQQGNGTLGEFHGSFQKNGD